MNEERCIVHQLNTSDLARAVDSPALAKLMADGWRVIDSFITEERDGRTSAALILAPPEKNDLPQLVRYVRIGFGLLILAQAATGLAILLG